MYRETCQICGCQITRKKGVYATDTIEGRSHATKHHYVAERFFGRSIFKNMKDPWGLEGQKEVFCYECHEELLHNPVLTPKDIQRFAELVERTGLNEKKKTSSKAKIAGRINLLHEVIKKGLEALA
jgi:hypothetical protein